MKDELWFSTFNNGKDKLKGVLKSKRDCQVTYDFIILSLKKFF